MKAILILCLLIAAVNCAARRDRPDFDCDGWCKSDGYSPVCSTKNKEFPNYCYLECKGKFKLYDGPCLD